jgi:hypothetical protein
LPFQDPGWIKPKAGQLVPSNLPLLKTEKKFKDSLPTLFGSKAEEVRRFILEDLIPSDIAFSSGFLDAQEIGKSTIDENLDIGVVQTCLTRLWQDSLELKLLSFVAKTANLNETEFRLLVAKYVMRTAAATGVGGSDLVKQILSSLQPIPTVQRQEEERAVPLRKVPATGSAGRRKPTRRSSTRARR